MNNQDHPKTASVTRRRRSVYRTVLSLGVAAIVAAWLPFSMLYINALSNRSAAASVSGTPSVQISSAGHPATTRTPVTTRTSGVSAGTPQTAIASAGQPTATLTSLTTRAS